LGLNKFAKPGEVHEICIDDVYLITAVPPPPPPTLVSDDFNDNILDTERWILVKAGETTVQEVNQRLEVNTAGYGLGGIRTRSPVDPRNLAVFVDGKAQVEVGLVVYIGGFIEETAETVVPHWKTDLPYYEFILRYEGYITCVRNVPGVSREQLFWIKCKTGNFGRIGFEIKETSPGVYEIIFYDGNTPIYNEDCTWLIEAIGSQATVAAYIWAEGATFAYMDNLTLWKPSEAPALHSLTLETPVPLEGGIVSPENGTFPYPENWEVSLLAIPDVGYLFEGWTVDGETYTDSALIVKMDKDYTVSASFSRDPNYKLLTIYNNLGGVTNPPSGVHAIPVGQEVTITATPEKINPPGITLQIKDWLIDGQSSGIKDSSIKLKMDEDHSVEVLWEGSVPPESWKMRIAMIRPDTPPAPPLDGPNYDAILDDIASNISNLKEINYISTRLYWEFDLDADPHGNVPRIREAPPYQPTLAETREAIRKIHAHGFKVVLEICKSYYIPTPEGWDGDTFTGPGFDADTFINNYFENVVLPIAQLCEEEGVECLVQAWEMGYPHKAVEWHTQHSEAWRNGIARVRQVYHGLLGHNVQAHYNQDGFETILSMDFLSDVDVIFFSLWPAASKYPFDVREDALDVWWTKERNYPADFKQIAEKFGKPIVINSGFQNNWPFLLSPWTGAPPGTPMDALPQRIAWRAALQAFRYQPWFWGFDIEEANESQQSHPPPYLTVSIRYHPENFEAIIKELRQTIESQGVTPAPKPVPPLVVLLLLAGLLGVGFFLKGGE
ncbi:MAG: hypothetical protein DRN81_05925, partial [Thermoproteota archaeon]